MELFEEVRCINYRLILGEETTDGKAYQQYKIRTPGIRFLALCRGRIIGI